MKNKKLFAILTLVCFMFTLMPVAAFAANDYTGNEFTVTVNDQSYDVENLNGKDVKLYEVDTTVDPYKIANATAVEVDAVDSAKSYVAILANKTVSANETVDATYVKTGATIAAAVEAADLAAAGASKVADSNSIAYVAEGSESVDVSYKYGATVVKNSAKVSLRVLDLLGNNVTANLKVWVTKEGSNAPVNTVTINGDVTTLGEYVHDLNGATTGAEKFTVEFFSTGKYEIHVSSVPPTIENGVITGATQFNYVGNVVEVISDPVAIANYGAIVTLPAAYEVEDENGNLVVAGNGETVKDGYVVSALAVKANNVAEEKVQIELINTQTGKPLTYKTLEITPVGAIDVDKTTVTTDGLGMASFKVSGNTEGVYKVYVTYGQFEFTIEVAVGATSANTIACVEEPANPVDILNTNGPIDEIDFEMYDVNGNVIKPAVVKAGWENAAKSNETKYAGYVAVVEQPAASKLKNTDLYFDGTNVVTKKNITAEGTYTFKVVLDNGNYATGTMEVKAFTTPVELVLEYPTTAELGATVAMDDLYWLDANKVQKAAKGITLAATGYAVANYDSVDGTLVVKTDEKYVGAEITITAVDERYNLVDTVTVKVANEAAALKFADKTAEVNVNNKILVNVVDEDGDVVTLGGANQNQQNANFAISYVILDKPEGARVFASTVAGSEKLDTDGSFKMNLTSNKVGNVTVQAVVKYSYTDWTTQTNVVKYYTGTQIFAVGNGSVGDVVVMSIGSNEIVINDAKATIDAAPIVENNRTFVPFRALAEAFGATVAYDEATQAVTAELNGVTVVMTIGSAEYTVNGEAKTADVAPFINGSRTMVPVRFAAEAFGIKVIPTYDENGATADILFNL